MSMAKRRKVEEDAGNDDTGDSWSDERFIETIQTVLGRYYYRSAERLQMAVKPPCYGDLERCSRNHWKSQDIETAAYAMASDCRSQKLQRNFSMLFKNINNICLMGLFPGPDILQVLLQMILDASDESMNPEEESSDYILDMGIEQFEMILLQFPPCILQLEPYYSTLLNRKCAFEDMQEFSDGENGIVCCVVGTLEKHLEEMRRNGKDEDIKPVETHNTEDMLRMLNFDLKKGFSSLVRSAKIERLFVVLHLLVKLMEFDLSMWMLRHPKKASESMLKPQKQPLIGKILWPNGDFSISLFMKKCFGVFVESIAQELPADQLAIFGRLIGLISNAVNLCEIQTTSEVQYPCIRQKSISLAETFMQITTDYRDPKPSLTIKVIKNITSPITKMLMIDNFFSTVSSNQVTGSVSITKIFKVFRSKDWIFQTKITQMEHVSLFVDVMKAWLDVYRLHDVFEAFSRSDSDTADVAEVRVEETKAPLNERVAKLEEKTGRKIRVDFKAIDRDLKKILKNYKLDTPIKYNEMNLDCNVIGIMDIYQLYLDEMKSTLKLHKSLVARHQKYPLLFAPWMALIEKHFGYALVK